MTVRQLQRKLRQPSIAEQVTTQTIGERAARARRAVILAEAAIDQRDMYRSDEPNGIILEQVTLDPEVAQAIVEALREAAMDTFWIGRVDEAVLQTAAPSDDERMALELIQKRA